ncbi:MAG: ribonuclease HII [Thermodesulfovibrionales bacterium]|nr:ribonuclease HII [Thermodesulfovibrionales bacterium]
MDLYEFDHQYRALGFSTIAGLDEAGRGPLAGPVVAGAVILPADVKIDGLNDSKKLSQRQRERIYQEIINHAICYGIGIVSNDDIDSLNILEASKIAMQRAISSLTVTPHLLIIDAIQLPNIQIPQVSIIKGDAKSASIAAASIIAKVSRDRIMDEMHEKYPQYGFNKHKGYPTKQHYFAILQHGTTPIHRKTFNMKNPYIF